MAQTAALSAAAAPDRPGRYQLFAAGPHAGAGEHERAFGHLDLDRIGTDFVDVLDRAGLTGRGGAAFPSWRKLASAVTRPGRSGRHSAPVLIGNGAEGEPLSFKDKTLLTHAPHLVLDGLLAAARAISATSLVLYVTPAAVSAVTAALGQRPDGRGISLREAPETFISGQASAVVNALTTGRALPQDLATHLSHAGYKQRPTVLLNVETLAHIGLIARHGPGWFRAAGSVADPGTRLVSISGMVPGQVFEIQGGASLGEVLAGAGVALPQVSAVLVGGYHGRWLDRAAVSEALLTTERNTAHGVHPGAGVLHVLPAGNCGLDATRRILNHLAQASAKQCGPCTFGLPALAETLDAVVAGNPDPGLLHELQRLCGLVNGRGACRHPDGTAAMLRSALTTFADDVEAHRAGFCTHRNTHRKEYPNARSAAHRLDPV